MMKIFATAVFLMTSNGLLADDHKPSAPFTRVEGLREAPYGGAVSANIINYSRAAPYIGVAGSLTEQGVSEADALGFKLLIDLRQQVEPGVAEEQALVQNLDISYKHIPLAADATALPQIDEIIALLSNPDHYPILLHCASANRAGAAWALYRQRRGVPIEIAIEEGRAVGLKSKEAFVRQLLSDE